MSLISIIFILATKEIAGFTIGGYLAEKAADIGTGKIWTELKKKIDDNSDTIEYRLYETIEKSVNDYFSRTLNGDICAAVCERIFSIWCKEGCVRPEQIEEILHQYSEFAKHDDVLEWYRSFQSQIVRDDILRNIFMMNNMQLLCEMQKNQNEKLDDVLEKLQVFFEKEKTNGESFPVYLSEMPTDIEECYESRNELENEIWNTLILAKKSVLLYGMGGIGKTAVAKSVLERIYSIPSEITGISRLIWVNYTNGNLKDSLIEAVNETRRNTDQEEAWEKIYNIIQRYRDSLLIVVDNIENQNQDDDLDKLDNLPCRVLVTSRVERIGGLCKYCVEHLSPEVCRKIFYYYYSGNHDNYYLNKILKLIDYHTVMLELLAKTANMEEKSLKEFYEMLVQKGFRLSEEYVTSGHPSLQKERRVQEQLKILFTISKCRIEDKDLLCQLSVIASIPFQYKNVKNWIGVSSKSQLEYLVETGWIQSDRKLVTTYVIHSVIASAIRFQNEEHLYEKCRKVIHSLSKELEYGDKEHGAEKSYLIPFSWSISDVLSEHLSDEQDAEFLDNLANIYFDIGNYEKAYAFFERALKINQKINGEASVLVSCEYYNLAEVSCYMYQFTKALRFSRKALEIRKRKYAGNDIAIIVVVKMLAGIYTRLNRLDRAERLYIWTAEQFEINPDTDILQLSTHYGDMATFYRDRGYMGDYEKAEKYYEKAEEGMQKFYGNKLHPEMAALYDQKALLYDEMGRYTDALVLLKKALKIKKDKLKEEHPDIVQSYGNIGLVYLELGEYKKALDVSYKALDIADKIWSSTFAGNADIYINIGLTYKDIGDFQKAEEFLKDALRIKEENYLSNHVAVLSVKNNIAQVYYCEEEYEKAIDLYESIIDAYKGEESLFLATVYDNLCNCFREKDRWEDAMDSCQKGWRIRKNILGEHSLDSAISMGNLALIYYEIGEFKEAEALFKEALEIEKENMPEKHERISTIYFNLGLVYDAMGRDEEALENYEKAITIDSELELYENVLMTAEYVADIYERMGMMEAAAEYRKEMDDFYK